MSESLDSVIRRIQKLLAIAQDDRANIHEAAAAASQAERLMRKFQIDNADLLVKQIKEDPEAMDTADCKANAVTNGTKAKTVPPWANFLSVGVAKLHECGCRVVKFEDGSVGIRFYGFKADAQVAKWTFDYLVATINRLANAYKNTADYAIYGRGVLTDYRKGVVQGILVQIRDVLAEREVERRAQAATSASRALVLVKSDKIIEKYGAKVVAWKPKQITARRDNAFGNGYEDGKKVDVNRRGLQQPEQSRVPRLA